MLEGGKSTNIGLKALPTAFLLETLESIIANAGKVFRRHGELLFVLRKRAISAAVGILSAKQPFNVCVRAIRLLSLLIRNHLDALEEDGEMILSLLIYLLDPDSGPSWKRILSMEVFKAIFADLRLVRLIYTKFDLVERRKDILRDLMGALVRIASEKPALTGLSHQSTVPRKRGITPDANDEQASIEAMGVAGIVGSAVSAEANVTGISVQWSVPKTPCIDQLDKSEPASMPDTYVYSLLLGLLGSFSDALTRFIMPLSVPREARSRSVQVQSSHERQDSEDGEAAVSQRTDFDASTKRKQILLLNPLELISHPQIENIKAVASMLMTCWPAFLATSSIFLYAALDAEHYHGLIRSLQKFTQVSGVLRLDTPRDALLTALGKAAVPADAIDRIPQTPMESDNTNERQFGVSSPTILSPTSEKGPPFEDPPATLNTRNLLCLRALLNLGIALGPTMTVNAWSIVLSTLQQSELVIKLSIEVKRHKAILPNGNAENEDILKTNLGGEIIAVQTATKKLFTSTTDYPSESFLRLLDALCGLVNDQTIREDAPAPAPGPSLSVTPNKRTHRAQRSISMTIAVNKYPGEQYIFLLDKLPVLLGTNKARLATEDPQKSGWLTMSSTLLMFLHDASLDSTVRLRSADLLNQMAIEALASSNVEEARSKAEIQKRALSLLQSELGRINKSSMHTKDQILGQLHERVLTALETIVQTSGEDMVAGWNIAFAIINSVFVVKANAAEDNHFTPHPQGAPIELVRASFRSIQLLGSDYLDRLPSPCLLAYVVALHDFGAQTEDLNIALTGTTSFWSLIEFLREHMNGPPHVVEKDALIEQASSKDVEVASNALWIIAMRHLAEMALDERGDVRNTAGKLLLRIFESYASTMSVEMWYECSQTIFLRLLNARVSDESRKTAPWITSSISLLEGFIKLLVGHIETLSNSSLIHSILNETLQTLGQLLKANHLTMDRSVFDSASLLINTMAAHAIVTEEAFRSIWVLWASYAQSLPEGLEPNSMTEQESNRAALTSYAECLLVLCQTRGRFNGIIDPSVAVSALEKVVFGSRHPLYTTDVTQASAEQEKVLKLLELLFPMFQQQSEQYLRTLIKIIKGSRPTESKERDAKSRPTSKAPSMVAVSGGAIKLLSSGFTQRMSMASGIGDSVVFEALQCLRDIIACTNARDALGEPSLWRTATIAAGEIVQHLVNVALESKEKQAAELNNLAIHLVAITKAILEASPKDVAQSAVAIANEEFDITSFAKIQSAVLPLLSSKGISNDVRQSYMAVLFRLSLLFEGFPEDLPETIETEPLSELLKIRNGYIDISQAVPRPRIAYVALDTLFSLVAGKDSALPIQPQPSLSTTTGKAVSYERTSLAKAASPYLILRSAIPLKAFIADQPLRGLMPIPPAVTKEIASIIEKYIALESLDQTIPPLTPASGNAPVVATPRGKAHLPHLHPLVLEFWSVLKRLPIGNGMIRGGSQVLRDVVDKWTRDAAPFTAEAVGLEVERDEWWK